MVQYGSGNAAAGRPCGCRWCTALRVLGLGSAASDDEIRSAHCVVAQVWEPDPSETNPVLRRPAEEKLKEINGAYQFLTSPQGQSQRCTGADPKRPESASPPPWLDAGRDEPERPSESGIRPRNRLRKRFAKLVGWCVILACAVIGGVVVLQEVDSFLYSNPHTSNDYGKIREQVLEHVAEPLGEMWTSVRQRLRMLLSRPEDQLSVHEPRSHGAHPTTRRMLPYITANLTQQEVEQIQGPPTEATENELVYQRSELYFRANHLVGWKIDPATPLRVKLWPDAVVDRGLRTFTQGSSKNEVLVVQGTPTMFSDNKFGYGRSEVYFENDRVIGWKNDPTTVRLRVSVP